MKEEHGIDKNGRLSIMVGCKCKKCNEARRIMANAIDKKIEGMLE